MKLTRQFAISLIQRTARHRRFLLTGLCLMAFLSLMTTRWHKAQTTQAAAVFNVITVTTAADEDVANGVCSLREAIIAANTNTAYRGCAAGMPGLDNIYFNIPGEGPHKIAPNSALPVITEPVNIDGTTQPGAICTTPGGLKIELSGENNTSSLSGPFGTGLSGLTFSADNSSVKGLVINRWNTPSTLYPNTNPFSAGVRISGRTTISCNYLGINVAGTATLPNGTGVIDHEGGGNNLIGGTLPEARNIISGNSFFGVWLSGTTSNRIEGNFIGTDVTGTIALGNQVSGVYIRNTTNNTVGGTSPGARNIISGNGFRYEGEVGSGGGGILILDPDTTGNRIQGNYIGTDVTGTIGLGNTIGVLLGNTQDNKVGDIAAAANNLIAFNYLGIAINHGLRNSILGNSIHSNRTLGIDLSQTFFEPNYTGVTPNDIGDGDMGANNLQNFPVLNPTLTPGVITGSLDSLPGNSAYPVRIEFFANSVCDPSGYGEGEQFLGATEISGPGSFTFSYTPVAGKPYITATATDFNGNTSEFSACQPDVCIATLPASLPAGQAGVNYSQSLAATPAGSYGYSLQTGNLPSGFVLNPTTGLLSGTTFNAGTYNFSIRAQGSGGCNATQSYTLVINCPSVTINPASLAGATVGTAYSQTLSATPAGGNYSFVASGLPAWASLNGSTGVISGTPMANGTFNFSVVATGFGSCSQSKAYSITVTGGGGGGCGAITLPASLPNGSVGQLYTESVAALPTNFYSYAATGDLPTGVTLFGAAGLLYGFPTTPGTYNFSVTATLGSCSGSRSYTVLIGAGMASSLTALSDFDGDGKSDLSVWRGTEGNWLVANSGDGQLRSAPWGASTAPYNDVTVSGDYDGDGKTDLAVFRRGGEHAGYWFIKRSSDGQVMSRFWGLGTDVPVPGDYDGDRKTDVAVWRGSTGGWYVWRSSDGGVTGIEWGSHSSGDVPVAGDYDGDSKTDVAVFRRISGDWLIRRSSDGQALNVKWGIGTDVPVPGDYDGDGKTDVAVWRGAEGAWQILQSSNEAVRTISLGAAAPGDWAVPGDYDGDGKADAAIWRESTGTWFVKRNSDNTVITKTLGQSGDAPVAARRN